MTAERFAARLLANAPLGAGVRKLTLQVPQFPHFRAGQYTAFVAADGMPVYFSIASLPSELPLIELHYAPTPDSPDVVRMETVLREECCTLLAPAGRTTLADATSARRVLILAAATGISQALALAQAELHGKRDTELLLYWGVRTSEALYAREILDALTQRWANFRWQPCVSDEPTWPGRRGLVIEEVEADAAWRDQDIVILAGSPAMVRASAQRLLDLGVPRERLRSDMLDP